MLTFAFFLLLLLFNPSSNLHFAFVQQSEVLCVSMILDLANQSRQYKDQHFSLFHSCSECVHIVILGQALSWLEWCIFTLLYECFLISLYWLHWKLEAKPVAIIYSQGDIRSSLLNKKQRWRHFLSERMRLTYSVCEYLKKKVSWETGIRREGNCKERCVCISHHDVNNYKLLIFLCLLSRRRLYQHLINLLNFITLQYSWTGLFKIKVNSRSMLFFLFCLSLTLRLH